jgi:hypothetical protein
LRLHGQGQQDRCGRQGHGGFQVHACRLLGDS